MEKPNFCPIGDFLKPYPSRTKARFTRLKAARCRRKNHQVGG
ncbi:hypothetical protein AZO1586R_112 [Bathymodiolus azoricus thioautotrophic gill symbiont]|uniref:Uncharacterized protein n=1 Tax=Bathymodiolus azoricus thioautotrophic gill symbiont TaxID=235205 RepID=A0ACA8ZNQ4_9GAMM|nr:hypothetical protein AZO1586R_112 [Bathymodiolus azoricus thioautotrophic gill symbiont]CAC9492553.1 hypothetical protein [uncultured Gammaproteobacteria bacterium]CAC9517869.1 hypothetical protein [uncultured Gammaproteobacteria bacterium]CAC9533542.1 hypothetical protein [uncultured Gammaproteobacteria bacterium]CAC9556404.1 hypothetical protein [uncultured Gammaproteobacteria bacterium]